MVAPVLPDVFSGLAYAAAVPSPLVYRRAFPLAVSPLLPTGLTPTSRLGAAVATVGAHGLASVEPLAKAAVLACQGPKLVVLPTAVRLSTRFLPPSSQSRPAVASLRPFVQVAAVPLLAAFLVRRGETLATFSSVAVKTLHIRVPAVLVADTPVLLVAVTPSAVSIPLRPAKLLGLDTKGVGVRPPATTFPFLTSLPLVLLAT